MRGGSRFSQWVCLHEVHHDEMDAHPHEGSVPSSQLSRHIVLSQLPRTLTMEPESQRPKGREAAISALNAAIGAMNLAEKISTIAPAKTVLGSVSTLLTLIRVCFMLFCNDLLQIYT